MKELQDKNANAMALRKTVALVGLIVLTGSAQTWAQTLRVYSSTVVTDEVVRLRDVASGDVPATLLDSVLAEAPPPGGARRLHVGLIRQLLRDRGANLASLRISGAAECTVSRPLELRQDPNPFSAPTAETPATGGAPGNAATKSLTLRSFIEAQATVELARYGGQAVVSFEADSRAFLDLASPPLEFRLIRRTGTLPGAAVFEVEVSQEGRALQALSVKANVGMARGTVVASRSILKDSIILPEDVRVETILVRGVQQPVTGDATLVVGRRAERYFAEGEPIDPQQIKSVPIVRRQQMVRVVARVGGVYLESVGQALEDATGGQLVRVTLVDRTEETLSGIATAPGVVMIGDVPAPAAGAALPDRRHESKPDVLVWKTGA